MVNLKSLGVDVKHAENVIEGRAGVDISTYIVKIFSETGMLRAQWTIEKMPEVFSLPVGKYTLEVTSHQIEKQAWESPWYQGEANFEITDGQVTEIGTVACTFQSIKVSIKYSDKLTSLMGTDTNVKVVCNDEGTLDFAPAETRAGYFQAIEGSSTLVATFTSTIKGQKVQVVKTLKDVAAGQHRIITFQVKTGDGVIPDETGYIVIDGEGLMIDTTVEIVDREGNVTIDDEVISGETRPGTEPGGDDPNPPTPPTPGDEGKIEFLSEYLSFDQSNDPELFGDPDNDPSLKPAVVDITSEKPMQSLKVVIESTSDFFVGSAGDMVPLEFDLCNLQPSIQDYVAKKGLPDSKVDEYVTAVTNMFGNDFKDKTEVQFNISQFVPLLANFDGTHTFTITVTDNVGTTKSINLTFFVAE